MSLRPTVLDEKNAARQDREAIRQLVFLVSTVAHSVLGTCNRLRVACGIVKDKRFRGVGFNGSVNGVSHCDDTDHRLEAGHCVATIHAEENATHNTDRQHLKGAKAIVTATPCINCVKTLLQSGIKEIDCYGEYSNSLGQSMTAQLIREADACMRLYQVDWQEEFQKLFDLLARDGGVLKNSGYRLKVTKEPL